MTASVMVPMGEPLLIDHVLVGAAINIGPEVLMVATGVSAGEHLTVALQWQRAEDAERHLAAMLADVRSRMPLPPVAQFPSVVQP